jgi:ribosomal 50S subunit-recycling heat shock protein
VKPTLHHTVKRIKLGDTFTVHTPRRDFKFRVIGLHTEASKRGELNTYHVERVLN